MNRLLSLLGIGVILIVLAFGARYLIKKIPGEKTNLVGDNLEVAEEAKNRYEGNELGLSTTSEKVNLEARGGSGGTGVATREMEGEVFLHTILANLSEPGEGRFYEGWLIRESDNDRVYTGRLTANKGGWLLEYVGKKDLSDHSLVWVTIEGRDDRNPEEKVLEGKFSN